jgi:hypothetical protein
MDEVYTMGGMEWVPVNHTRTMHLTSQHAGTEWVLCFSISTDDRSQEMSCTYGATYTDSDLTHPCVRFDEQRSAPGAWSQPSSARTPRWHNCLPGRDLSNMITASFPPRSDESCRWAGLCSSLLKLTLELELRELSLKKKNHKFKKIWKIKSRRR